MTNTTNDKGEPGDRIFRLAVVNRQGVDNIFRFYFSVGDNHDYVFRMSDSMPILEWINVTVKQANFSGTYKVQVFINGSLVHEVDNPSPVVYENVTAYASEILSRPADGTFINLKIFPGRYYF